MATVGDWVVAEYNSGVYVGEVVEITHSGKAAVRIEAVLKHPDQGDLHHPQKGDAKRFFQRRALAHTEIALVPQHYLQAHTGEVPDYEASLRTALEREERRLEQIELWAHRSLDELKGLRKDYGF